MQHEAKLSAAKSKMDQMMTALKKDFQSTLEEKDAKICALEEEIRDFQRATDQQRSWVVAAENDRLCGIHCVHIPCCLASGACNVVWYI